MRACRHRRLAAALLLATALSEIPGLSRAATAQTVVATPETIRDLLPGERLPYHKHDHPSPDQRDGAPSGYQRHDSFPVETVGFGTVVEHSFDFGADQGRRFGIFDIG